MCEGKHMPKERLNKNPKTKNFGNTCGSLLCLCKLLYFTGKVVVLDRRFFVLKDLIELKKFGVFAHVGIEK